MSDERNLIVGIDFGTCNIKSAVFDSKKGRVEPYKFNKSQNSDVIPNIVDIRKEKILIGEVKGTKKKDEQTIVTNIKRHLEEESWKVYVEPRQKDMTAVEIAAEEFQWMCENIEKKTKTEITDAVITVPVCFSEMQKNRIRKAAESAGINLKEVVTEPFAGLFSYSELAELDDSKVLIFDFGGGTLDLSIFDVSKIDDRIRIKTLASRGIHFGGNDITQLLFDKIIAEHHMKEFLDEVDYKLKHEFLDKDDIPDADKVKGSEIYSHNYEINYSECMRYFMKELNSLKEGMCESTDEKLTCMFTECMTSFSEFETEYSYNELVSLIEESGILSDISDTLDDLIDIAMIDYEDVSKIIMIGGTSKIPLFREKLKSIFSIEDSAESDIFVDYENDAKYNAVAVGAVEYLKYNDIKFVVHNRLSYEIGTIESDGRYYRRMDINAAFNNEPTIGKPIVLEKDNANYYKLRMYQVFHDTTASSINVNEDAIYMGCFRFDRNKYDLNKKYLMELFVDSKGILHSNILDGSRNFIETLEIDMAEDL